MQENEARAKLEEAEQDKAAARLRILQEKAHEQQLKWVLLHSPTNNKVIYNFPLCFVYPNCFVPVIWLYYNQNCKMEHSLSKSLDHLLLQREGAGTYAH